MAEIRNTFVKSKMNKDLDDRLLSKGEYRNAENVQISRSEGEDVGALENVLGNNLITNWGLNAIANLEVIGYTRDEANDRAFFIATNYTDISKSELDNPAPYGASCYILMFDNKAVGSANRYKILVQGRFLNFSKTHPIFGIDLIEDLLFWTDNRNQPRKINVTKAIADNTYYINEDQISVAKYYPYEPPSLLESISVDVITQTTPSIGGGKLTCSAADIAKVRTGMILKVPYINVNSYSLPVIVEEVNYTGNFFIVTQTPSPSLTGTTVELLNSSCKNVTEKFLPPNQRLAIVAIAASGTEWELTYEGIGGYNENALFGINSLVEFTGATGEILVTENQTVVSVGAGTFKVDKNPVSYGMLTPSPTAPVLVQIKQPNPWYTDTWPGDKDYLSDKFVRFAYRFKFDDGEYSLISPFTQPAFIPKQDGYINTEIPDNTAGNVTSVSAEQFSYQEKQIRDSTIVSFFENKVQDVLLKVNLPYTANTLESKLKVSEIDIIYKESDGLAFQLLETIPAESFSKNPDGTTNTTNTILYKYQSRRPFRTLPERETLRVFDKAPIRALSQSVTGNRVIYGNFIDKHTPPENLDYNVTASEKLKCTAGSTTFSRETYPTHTLKQNRTYQVGIVLADRYGRQSDVILSSITPFQFSQTGSSEAFDGSTVFHPYNQGAPVITGPPYNPRVVSGQGTNFPWNWFGDSLKVLFRSKIPETVTYADGYPGLYKSGEYTATVTPAVVNSTTVNLQSGTLDPNVVIGNIITGPASGGGTFTTSIKSVNPATSTITVVDSISIDNLATVTMHGPENKLGWYTYKIVVKQQEQEYYNVYLPMIVNGIPAPKIPNAFFPTSTTNNTGVSDDIAYTTLFSDNINKIPAELEEVQPEQTQFRTSDEILYPRVGPTNSARYVYPPSLSNAGSPIVQPVQYNVGQKFITADTIGKLIDIGVNQKNNGVKSVKIVNGGTGYGVTQNVATISGVGSGNGCTLNIDSVSATAITAVSVNSGGTGYSVGDILSVAATSNATVEVVEIDGSDATPYYANGIYDAKSNPSIAKFSTYNTEIGCGAMTAAGPGYPIASVLGLTTDFETFRGGLSILEVKPTLSRLEIFWETSTSGLVSNLNKAIDDGANATPDDPTPPMDTAPVTE